MFKWSVFVFFLVAHWSAQHLTVAMEFSTLDHLKTSTNELKQADTVMDLIGRLIGSRSIDFTVTINASVGPPQRDTFKLITNGGRVHITGNSGVAAAWSFYYYLAQYCGCHVSWAGDQLKLPASWPDLGPAGVLVTSADRFRYYQNVCTTSYSFVWWNWTRWEREIDWMVMNGINLPLAFNGQEAIWQRVFLKMGFTQSELDNHFGGAAFLSWSRMGNMHGWGGPLPQSWHTQQIELQHKILQRMRDFGMIPVLPAFPGHVPNAITRVFPSAKVSRLDDWGSFNSTYCCTLLLDLNDPLFQQFGKAFILEYTKEFGTDHIYNTDTFNEMIPQSSDPAYLNLAGKAVYSAMLAGDEKAIWLMQGWLFLDTSFWKPEQAKALLTSVPQGKMIVLDLFSEVSPLYVRLESYYGQPFIWCMLHNFGGTVSMYGVVDAVNQGPSHGRAFTGSTMVGVGITPEGINQNNVMYEFMLENGWRVEPRNLTQWFDNYAVRRYGRYDASAAYAWQILKSGVYNCTNGQRYHGQEVVIKRPQLGMKIKQTGIYNCTLSLSDSGLDNVIVQRPNTDLLTTIWYNVSELFIAWDHILLAADTLGASSLYRYDLVDISRQSLQIILGQYYDQLIASYKKKTIKSFKLYSELFLGLLVDLDTLLLTDDHFLLGHWLEDAKALGVDESERILYEYNARNQITLWGPTDKNILDYANKQWSGLIQQYYFPRWQLFIDELSLHWNDTFNQDKYNEDVFREVEQSFTFDRTLFPIKSQGDQIHSAQEVHKKYRPVTRMKNKKNFSYNNRTFRQKPLKKFL